MSRTTATSPQDSSATEGQPGAMEQQHEVKTEGPERVKPNPQAGGTSHCTIFTYFKGDINSVVDEHFSRALQRVTGAEHSPAKRRTDNPADTTLHSSTPQTPHSQTPLTFSLVHCHTGITDTHSPPPDEGEDPPLTHWPPAPLWPHVYVGATLPSAPRSMARCQVFSGYPSKQSAPTEPWLLPNLVSAGPAAGSLMYPVLPPPGAHRPCPGQTMPAGWAASPPMDPEAPHMDPEAPPMPPDVPVRSEQWRNEEGFQCQEKQKDIYWY
ncbi:transcription cofactor vestigial-like protein 2 [Narcine bancroftii]|uniref:transcription cofactor vestigial-like protein 2 n=1 Tax=Narcine bancroftii TaxID=1343680 RepID=UPI0038313823